MALLEGMPAGELPNPWEPRDEGRRRRQDFETWLRDLLVPDFLALWEKHKEGPRKFGEQRLAAALFDKMKQKANAAGLLNQELQNLPLSDQGIVVWAREGISRKVIRRLKEDMRTGRTGLTKTK